MMGQMDAMELTPSVSSSHKRNRSAAADQALDANGSTMKFAVNRFNGNGAKLDSLESQMHDPSRDEGLQSQGVNLNPSETGNDSIMNPAIQRGATPD